MIAAGLHAGLRGTFQNRAIPQRIRLSVRRLCLLDSFKGFGTPLALRLPGDLKIRRPRRKGLDIAPIDVETTKARSNHMLGQSRRLHFPQSQQLVVKK